MFPCNHDSIASFMTIMNESMWPLLNRSLSILRLTYSMIIFLLSLSPFLLSSSSSSFHSFPNKMTPSTLSLIFFVFFFFDLWILLFFLGLNITPVLANMPRLSFGLCKKKNWNLSSQNFLSFKKVLGPLKLLGGT